MFFRRRLLHYTKDLKYLKKTPLKTPVLFKQILSISKYFSPRKAHSPIKRRRKLEFNVGDNNTIFGQQIEANGAGENFDIHPLPVQECTDTDDCRDILQMIKNALDELSNANKKESLERIMTNLAKKQFFFRILAHLTQRVK